VVPLLKSPSFPLLNSSPLLRLHPMIRPRVPCFYSSIPIHEDLMVRRKDRLFSFTRSLLNPVSASLSLWRSDTHRIPPLPFPQGAAFLLLAPFFFNAHMTSIPLFSSLPESVTSSWSFFPVLATQHGVFATFVTLTGPSFMKISLLLKPCFSFARAAFFFLFKVTFFPSSSGLIFQSALFSLFESFSFPSDCPSPLLSLL